MPAGRGWGKSVMPAERGWGKSVMPAGRGWHVVEESLSCRQEGARTLLGKACHAGWKGLGKVCLTGPLEKTSPEQVKEWTNGLRKSPQPVRERN